MGDRQGPAGIKLPRVLSMLCPPQFTRFLTTPALIVSSFR